MRFVLAKIALLLSLQLSAQLTAGDIMFVGYNADGNDGFSILALVDIPANSTIYFTDNEWNGSPIGGGGAFNNVNEGEITWSTGGTIITAGTVINFLETNSAANPGYGSSVGNISGTINLNASNEVLYAFQGTNDSTPTTFLSAIANDGFDSVKGTLTNTGLTAGTNATSITGDEDIMVYTGSISCNTTVADCAAAIATATNWSTQDGGGDQSADTTAPDFPADVPPSFGGTALPVELTLFEAKTRSDEIVVFWETASELNNDYFELHRSFDGVNFDIITQVNGNGTSSQYHRYQYADREAISSRYVYYRLRQVDYDGQFEWFETILFKRTEVGDGEVNLYPNPIVDSKVNLKTNLAIERIEILTMDGKKILSFDDPDNSIELTELKSGNYLIRIFTQEGLRVKRINVVN
ncbi:T9SS type A sorting domain-containing protein [Ekhidna sp.]|uniref:T9SS type A sorting domain-containing protein n=1 Tax=Ekhidna sp. TaxID=2608089 RepID=UPI003299F02C